MRLLIVEMRRALARRMVRVLVALALVVTGIVGISVYAANDPLDDDPAAAFIDPDSPGNDPRFLTALWPVDDPDGALLLTPAGVLMIVALAAGASTTGAEWKAGTVTTLLTWEPRRTRVVGAKLGAAGILAAVIALALLGAFALAFLPTVALKGTTEGADGEWLGAALAGSLRIAAVTGLAAVLGAAMAMIGRNTSAAVGVALGYFVFFETLVRGMRPRLQHWLLSENVATFLTGERLEGVRSAASPAGAAVTLVVYLALVSLAAGLLFTSRDLAGEG